MSRIPAFASLDRQLATCMNSWCDGLLFYGIEAICVPQAETDERLEIPNFTSDSRVDAPINTALDTHLCAYTSAGTS